MALRLSIWHRHTHIHTLMQRTAECEAGRRRQQHMWKIANSIAWNTLNGVWRHFPFWLHTIIYFVNSVSDVCWIFLCLTFVFATIHSLLTLSAYKYNYILYTYKLTFTHWVSHSISASLSLYTLRSELGISESDLIPGSGRRGNKLTASRERERKMERREAEIQQKNEQTNATNWKYWTSNEHFTDKVFDNWTLLSLAVSLPYACEIIRFYLKLVTSLLAAYVYNFYCWCCWSYLLSSCLLHISFSIIWMCVYWIIFLLLS